MMDIDDSTRPSTITTYQNGPGIDNKLSVKQNGTPHYFLEDHLGSTVALTDDSGNVTDSNAYDSFGNPTNGRFSSRYQFTGREYDLTTGLQYSRARWYDPTVGRFISEDPIGFAGRDVNLYGYVQNNPIKFKDPSGKDIFGVSVAATGFVGGGEGSGATISNATGFSTNDFDFGMAEAYGGFTPYCKNGWAIGGALGASWGGFYSNAQKWDDFAGGFDSHQFGAGPLGSFNLDFGTTTDGRNIWVVHFSPPVIGGTGGTYGYANFNTYTPPDGIVTSNKVASSLSRDIEALYGRKGCHCPY